MDKQVFRDDSRRRWRLLTAALFALACAFAVLGVFFAGNLRVRPPTIAAYAAPVSSVDLDALGREARVAAHADPNVGVTALAPIGAGQPVDAATSRAALRIGFVDAAWRPALRGLEAHASSLTHAAFDVLHVKDAQGGLVGQLPDDVRALAKEQGLAVLEVVDTQQDGCSHPADITAIGRDPALASKLAVAIALKVHLDEAAGVLLDLEQDPADPDGMIRAGLVAEVAAKLRPDHKLVGVRVAGDARPSILAAEARVADLVVVDAFIALEPGSRPAPDAPRGWVERAIETASGVVPHDKLVVALRTGGVGWPVRVTDLSPAGTPRVMTWAELVARARLADTMPSWDREAGELVVALPGTAGIPSSSLVRAYADDDGSVGMVAWMGDAATLADVRVLLARRGISSIALANVGGEDPRIWRVLAVDPTDREALRAVLEPMPSGIGPEVIGNGVAMHVDFTSHDGRASVEFAIAGRVEREDYLTLPAVQTVVRRGQVPHKTIVLTFDDGPSREWTPKVLDILREQGVHAAFFVVGSAVVREPRLLERIVAEGHEVGNHSFTHPDLGRIAPDDADLQINSENRLIEAVTGRSTVLFRPPFRSDGVAEVLEDLLAIENGERNGMITVTSNVDSLDWRRPEPDELVAYIVNDVESSDGDVVLLHDGGGDRSRTVAALRPLIQTLRARGFRFAPISEVFGYADASKVNPPVQPREAAYYASRTVWYGGSYLLAAISVLALVALGIGLLRFAALALGAAVDRAEEVREREALRRSPRSPQNLAVSVVVPAYNEAKVIERTLLSVLSSRGVDVEVIVVDDGSTDDTADVVSRAFYIEPRVKLLRVANGGKARALNIGFEKAAHPIVVALDADTIFLPDTIVELARKFDDERVAAVAGRAVVGNVNHFIGRWQALEYVIGQGIERRAWHLLGVVTVVPGAVGAWHRDRCLAVGGFGTDTLAEDCDLTVMLQARGFRVSYAPHAVALTEAPESVRALLKQRFRWCFGVLQTVWKHRAMMWRPPAGSRVLGLLLLPTILLAHIAMPLFAPLADLAAVVAIALGNGRQVVPYAVALLLAELVLTLIAVRLDRARLSLMIDWLVNRVVYRWLLFFALARAVTAALRGGAVGWGKLARTGTVKAPAAAARLSGEGRVTA